MPKTVGITTATRLLFWDLSLAGFVDIHAPQQHERTRVECADLRGEEGMPAVDGFLFLLLRPLGRLVMDSSPPLQDLRSNQARRLPRLTHLLLQLHWFQPQSIPQSGTNKTEAHR